MAKNKNTQVVDYSLHPSRLVCEIVAANPYWKYAPKFPTAVEQAANLVINFVPRATEHKLTKRERDFISKIAHTIHTARIERGF